MTVKKITVFAVSVLLISFFAVLFLFNGNNESSVDAVAVNDIAQTFAENWESAKNSTLTKLPGSEYKIDYVAVDNGDNVIAKTRKGLNETLSDAIKNRDTIVDIKSGDTVLGKLYIYNNSNILLQQYRENLKMICAGIIVFLIILCIAFSIITDRTIFRPFRKLKEFAENVATGNFNVPLKMDKGNQFGAFTESFDLMRDELAKAKESERLANQSKKELVASLSHDIKTPVASIKAVSEVLMLSSSDKEQLEQLHAIDEKADQINALITNLFNATLEELQVLSVKTVEFESTEFLEIIKTADYNDLTIISPIPECIVLADKQRLTQVIDNIISNSYKYANTSISVTSKICEKFLEISFRDYGKGVLPDELPLLFHKFYRAKNAAEKSGAGMGLYISKYFMTKMGGDIECRNTDDGFEVILKFKLS